MELPKMVDGWAPSRVLINIEGEAVPAFRARRDYGVTPDVIFCRLDGWTLGAPRSLEPIAYRMWIDDWVAFVRRPETQWKPMTEYWEKPEL